MTQPRQQPAYTSSHKPVNRFLSREECAAIAAQVAHMGRGGGNTDVWINTSWTGNHRWARNQIITSGDVRHNTLWVMRSRQGATSFSVTNQIDVATLEATVRRAERTLMLEQEQAGWMDPALALEPHPDPELFFESTYALESEARAEVMHQLIKPAAAAGMLAAGSLQVSAFGDAVMGSSGMAYYAPMTTLQYSVTVRDPDGTGSGWAGLDGNDWRRINAEQLSAIALDKCLRSRNPVAIEPGRYRTILEPQAVADFVSPLFERGGDAWVQGVLDLQRNEERGDPFPFKAGPGETRIGERVMDARLTITEDPMDPELGFPPVTVGVPFGGGGTFTFGVYHPVTWIEQGVLKTLAYNREWAIQKLLQDTSVQQSGAFRISGGTTTVDEMIAHTTRGILVTRFWDVKMVHVPSLTCSGWTRDGLWLIERGKITKPIRNFRVTDSILAVLNNVEELGVPQRVFRPAKVSPFSPHIALAPTPAVVPPMAIREFNFTALTGAL